MRVKITFPLDQLFSNPKKRNFWHRANPNYANLAGGFQRILKRFNLVFDLVQQIYRFERGKVVYIGSR